VADPNRPIRLVAVAGARPNFMKIAPLLRELERRPRFQVFLVHTGQHYDERMSTGFFRDLGIARCSGAWSRSWPSRSPMPWWW